ncbi:MAG TPA: HAMP domain-containing sensor histidine kinase, partial [Pirellulales bacterium]
AVMLFLQLPVNTAAANAAGALPLDDAAALALERALLATDDAARLRELSVAIASHRNFAGWVLRLAELRTGQTINHAAQAAAWLCGSLATELAVAISSDCSDATANDIGWRLPALAAKLAHAEHRMADFDRRLEREKLESLKELAYGASHEINNPLANIAARAQTLLEDEADPERRRKLTAVHRQAMRAHEMIADLMLFARPPKLARTTIDLRQLAKQVVDELHAFASEKAVQLQFNNLDTPILVSADPTQLGVAISGIVKNGIEAVPQGGHVHVATNSDRDAASVVVSDDGPGISPEIRQHMFDPFFSGREAGRGLGFGLSKSWRIITDHGGEIGVMPRVIGAEFVIRLPVASAPEQPL